MGWLKVFVGRRVKSSCNSTATASLSQKHSVSSFCRSQIRVLERSAHMRSQQTEIGAFSQKCRPHTTVFRSEFLKQQNHHLIPYFAAVDVRLHIEKVLHFLFSTAGLVKNFLGNPSPGVMIVRSPHGYCVVDPKQPIRSAREHSLSFRGHFVNY